MPAQKKTAAAAKKPAAKKVAASKAQPAKADSQKQSEPPKNETKVEKKVAPAPRKLSEKVVQSNPEVAKVAVAKPTQPAPQKKQIVEKQPVQKKIEEPPINLENFENLDTFVAQNDPINAEPQQQNQELEFQIDGQDGIPKKVSELTFQQKKLIREQRFAGGQNAELDPKLILEKIEADALKRQQRAEKFGLGDTEETADTKRKDRMERFKLEQQGGAAGVAETKRVLDEEKEKQAARLARFGNPGADAGKQNDGGEDAKRGPLEFTLDQYKSKIAKEGKGQGKGKFLKKRHHDKVAQDERPQQGAPKGGKRFKKGAQGPPQQGHRFRKGSFDNAGGQNKRPFKRAKHHNNQQQ